MPATVPDDAPAPAATEESFAHELLLERRRVD
jgi:hypothetical protein